MGGSTENSAYGVTKNPHDTSRVPGGSSGGSAAAVAAECAILTLGSDTGGSIRQPASFCGVVGLKPTYGSVSRHGLMAMSSSLDVIGPITKTVAGAKTAFDIIKGKDPLDSTSDEKDPAEKKEKYKIGVPRALLTDDIDKDVLEAFEKDLKTLQDQGHEIIDIELPSLKYSLAVYYIIMPCEVSSNMSRYDGVRFGAHVEGKTLEDDYKKTRSEFLGEEVKRRIMLGTHALSSGHYDAYYNKAWQVRTKMKEEVAKVFEKEVDVIMLPTSPTPAFKIGENTEDPLKMYLTDILTVSANLLGVPAISVPTQTVDREGKQLPVGSQILGPHFHEEWLFDLGGQLE
jgi:aspartyl-tRNA(Asn)/glutamyl-tRNA(Gln) amidotransferase subunit A